MVTPEEQALIADRMAEAGISNMGAYMRKMALNGYVLHVDLSDIRELVALQRRCANNLNQVAVHANTYGIYPSEITALQKDYKAAKYSRKYLAEHEAELADYRAAKATMGELLGGAKLPKMAELKEKRRQLAARKKALYTEYRLAQEEMRQAVAVKANIDHLLGVTDGQRKKEQER